MSSDFKSTLLRCIPFSETSSFFERTRQSVDVILALGVTNTEEMLVALENNMIDDLSRQKIIPFAAWLNDDRFIEPLIRISISESESVEVRRSAMVYLAVLSRSQTYKLTQDKIFRTLKNISRMDKLQDNKISAISAFHGKPSLRAFYLMVEIIQEENNPKVRDAAVRAVSSIPQSDKQLAFELFMHTSNNMEEDISVRAYSIEGLGYLRNKLAEATVISALSDNAPEIRYMSAFALGELGDPSYLSLLQTKLTDYESFEGWGSVADAVIEAIEKIKNSNNS